MATEIELAEASRTTSNGPRDIATPAPQTIPNAGDEFSLKLSEYITIVQNLSGRISSLQKSAFTLANYYFVSQAVIFTALSTNTSLVCHDVWFPLFLSLLPGALNLFAFFKIGQEYIETMFLQKEYKKLRREHEVRKSGQTLTQVLDDEETKNVEKKEKKRLTGILYSCMCAFSFLALVIAVGSWLSTQKEAMVADIVDDQNQDNWKFQFRRDLYDWERDQLQNLVQCSCMNLMMTAFSGGGAKISFFQSSLLILNGKNIDRCVEDKELFTVWKNTCPPKEELIVWDGHSARIVSAKSVLVRRGILDNRHNICPLCNIEEESPDHLLLLCNVARKLWDEIFVCSLDVALMWLLNDV
ncbi:hypothetical protein RHSIM_Rhsim02G0190000 [Rhododendron simsii]|uniref:Reverse transcriptase zinc-binding domain-containing protein n=1 Tax=Rhododendron simsii TaxID=118357 RepID=A0A834LZ39_RHOSS|nr:hypothetical protein RHSIM_Rhsim02G0190000 [Rhododendron simsii]